MSKPRMCPHCKEQIPVENGISFSEDGVTCTFCGKLVYAITESGDNKITKTSTSYGYGGGMYGYGTGGNGNYQNRMDS
jgi:hypothetical protein